MALWPPVKFDPNPSPERLADTTTSLQMGIVGTFYGVAIIFVTARIYVRAVMIKSFGKDDIALIITAGLISAGFSYWIIQSQNGLGRHIELVPDSQAQTFRFAGYMSTLLIAHLGLAVIKTAIGFNLLRFCEGMWSWYRWLVWAVLWLVWVYTTIFFVRNLQLCTPLAKFWDLKIKDGSCTHPLVYAQFGQANSGLNIFTDMALAVIPVPIIWRIKLPVRVRLTLIGVLSLGYLSVVFGIIKTIYQVAFAREVDRTYNIAVPFCLQLSTGLVTASCVALRPLLNKVVRLNDTAAYGTGGPSKQSGRGTGSGGAASRSNKGFELDEFGNDKLGFRDAGADPGFGTTTARIQAGDGSFYNHASGDSGSEEVIVSATGKVVRKGEVAAHGITRTREVSVGYAV